MSLSQLRVCSLLHPAVPATTSSQMSLDSLNSLTKIIWIKTNLYHCLYLLTDDILCNRVLLLVQSEVSISVGVVEVVQRVLPEILTLDLTHCTDDDWHAGRVVLHALDQPHPVDQVHLAGEGAVPGVAENSQVEAVLSLERSSLSDEKIFSELTSASMLHL